MNYNGWKNKETWLANVWIGDLLQEYQEDLGELSPEFISEVVEQEMPEASGLSRDLLDMCLFEVDYVELANSYN